MKKKAWLILILAVMLAASACLSCTSGDSDDDDDDDDAADDDDDTQEPVDWSQISIVSVCAPDQISVEVTLSDNPGKQEAELPGIYELTSDFGSLEVISVAFDDAAKIVYLFTEKQKLGLTYTLSIRPDSEDYENLTADFPSADTAVFWAWDFASWDQYQLTAYRAGVGDVSVIYIEQGQSAVDIEETMDIFDEQIYPTETDLFIDAPDFDGNGKILILGLDGGEWFGGYFYGVNSVSEQDSMDWWGIHSNEMEMIYINVEGKTFFPTQIVPHEFQHLLYQERHGFQWEYWDYHDEGLAESAVHAVFGVNQGAVDHYLADPYGTIGNGLSLVHWTYGLYDNYVQAYLWWIYLASQLDGLCSLADIFNLGTGNPTEVDQMIADELGSNMPSLVFENRLAIWIQDESGPYGFNGLLSFDPASAPTVDAGTDSVNLEPYAGALFRLSASSVDYPGTEGAHIVYAGIDGSGNVDVTAPFDISGGALLTYNSNTDTDNWPAEHSGPDIPAIGGGKRDAGTISPAWLDPPPFNPYQTERLKAWRDATLRRIMEGTQPDIRQMGDASLINGEK